MWLRIFIIRLRMFKNQQLLEETTRGINTQPLIGLYIKSYKGVRRGDSLSPIFFKFVVDGLARMIRKA
jgi:hypothetical protein